MRTPVFLPWLVLGLSTSILCQSLPDLDHDRHAAWLAREAFAESSQVRGLPWQAVGPTFNGGRIEACAVHEREPNTLWVAAGTGGLWKSENAGLTFRDVLDGQVTNTIGAIAIDPRDPRTVWVGTGENLRAGGYTVPGIGVLRTRDGGASWQPVGLPKSHHIGAIAIDPQDSQRVLVAVMGRFWRPYEERGIFLTEDDGKTWRRVLFENDRTGGFDVAFDTHEPNVVFATTWQFLGGSTDHPVYRSADGGRTWNALSLPVPAGNTVSRSELDLARSQDDTLYVVALLGETRKAKPERTLQEGGYLFRSIDGGQTFERRNEQPIPGISWAFADVRVDPTNADHVFVLGVRLWESWDGGKTFTWVGGDISHLRPSRAETLHLDQCDLWIDPTNSKHMLLGNDGGAYVTHDGGEAWLHLNILPIGEFYDISLQPGRPTLVYGGTQDTSSVFGPLRPLATNRDRDWRYVWLDPWSGGDGFLTYADPSAPGFAYYESQFGGLVRKHLDTYERHGLKPRHGTGESKLETDWRTPYFVSPHNALTLYFGAQRVYRSVDRGDHWFATGPDVVVSADGTHRSRAITAMAESTQRPGWLWIGTDRGIVQWSRDGGATWTEAWQGLPEQNVKSITASRHALERAYVTLSGTNLDDYAPHVFATDDAGKTWRSIANGLPHDPVNTLIEDSAQENLLYLGTDQGAYVTFDRGMHWMALGHGLPVVSVQDLELDPTSRLLVAATHGRSLHAIDTRPLRDLARAWPDAPFQTFSIRPARRPRSRDAHNDYDRATRVDARISFWQANAGETHVAIRNGDKTLHERRVTAHAGLNQILWDLTWRDVPEKGVYFVPGREHVGPGEYTVEVRSDDGQGTQTVRVLAHDEDWP
ncbi:MAG: hypothetical protein H6834_05235 [Planctomycetes bacterium]|nr:hypothetical protein [Planctomycetota bacterium]